MKLFLGLFTLLFSFSVLAAQISNQDLAQLKTLDSKNYDTSSGKDLKLLYFWATWCPDCKEKIRGPLKEVAASPDYNFLLVNAEKDLGVVKNFVEKENLKFDIYTDFDKTVRKSLKVFSVPQWVLLKRSADSFEILGSEAGFDQDKIKALVAANAPAVKKQ